MLGSALLHFRAISNFVDLLVEDHFLELIGIVRHHLKLNIAEFYEIVSCAWLFDEWIVPENGELVTKLLLFIACQELSMEVEA